MTDHQEENIDLVFGKAVMKGAIIGLPVMLALVPTAVWLITEETAGVAFSTGVLAGVLLGVFGGGFIGVLAAMKH